MAQMVFRDMIENHQDLTSKNPRRYRQSPLEHAPATVSRPSKGVKARAATARALSTQNCGGVHGALGATPEAKSDDSSTQNPRVQKRVQKCARLPPEPSRVRLCHGLATLETKSDDHSTQNPPSTQNCGGVHGRDPRGQK